MRASLIAAAVAAWLHQLTGLIDGGDLLEGHGVRGGKAMIATLRRRLIAVPARLVSHGRQLIMRLAPGEHPLPHILAPSAPCPPPADRLTSTTPHRNAVTGTPPQATAARPRTRERPQTREPGATRAITMPARRETSHQDHLLGCG